MHPDLASDEQYVLYRQEPNGEYIRVFSSSSLSYVRLKMVAECSAYEYNHLEVPTFKIEVE